MYWYGGNDTMNQITIHEPYTDIEIRFGLEDISINIYKFAKDFLKENYDIDFRIHFEIVDNIADGTGITAGALVTKQTMCNDKVLYEVSDKIELLRSFFEVFNSRVLLNIIKHELVHYALFEKYGTGCNDGDELFESECKRLGID